MKTVRGIMSGTLALVLFSFFIGASQALAQEDTADVWRCDGTYTYDNDERYTEVCEFKQMKRDMNVDEVVASLVEDGYRVFDPDDGTLTGAALSNFNDAYNQAYDVMDCVFLYKTDYEYAYSDVLVCPAALTPQIAEEILEESETAVAREASNYYSRAVLNRVRALRATSKSGFSPPSMSPTAAEDTATGLNAGDAPSAKGIDNLSVSLGGSETRSSGRFKNRSLYLLATTDRVIDTETVIGFGLGLENSRENVSGTSGRGWERKSAGATLTAYGARILNEHFLVAPQLSVAYLRKRTERAQVVQQEDDAWRMMGSLSVLGQHALDNIELSGAGQVTYTHEDTEGAGNRVYVGQGVLNGELTYTGYDKAHPFIGLTGGYDFVRSAASGERFGYEISAGLRAAPGSRRNITLSAAYGKRDDQNTKSGNLFLRVSW